MIKTFRGLLADETQQRIRLSTNDGLTGYKIVKLQLYPNKPGDEHYLSAVKVFTVEQSGTPNEVTNFNDPTLIAAAFFQDNSDKAYPADLDVVFDNITFNQDIYITHKQKFGTASINYHIELEQVKLDVNQATVATLKDMRGRE